jgi:hypothetical protein
MALADRSCRKLKYEATLLVVQGEHCPATFVSRRQRHRGRAPLRGYTRYTFKNRCGTPRKSTYAAGDATKKLVFFEFLR